MKKKSGIALFVLFLGLSFLAGYWMRSWELPRVPVVQHLLAKGGDLDRPGTEDDSASSVPGSVRVAPEKQQLLGVRLETVQNQTISHRLRLFGRVAADETRIYRINAAVDGWIRDVKGYTTGALVRKDDVLAHFYSPEFLSAEQAYIYALGSLDRFRASGRDGPPQMQLTEVNIRQYKDTLMNLGMSDLQIKEIARTRQYSEQIQIRSPVAGFITLRNVSPGLRIEKGSELYRITDLGRVWILADVYETDAGRIRPGTMVKAILRRQQKELPAKVTEVLPQFDPVSRTLKVRLEADNCDYSLRPDMFVDLEIPVSLPKAVTVSQEAVLDSGLRQTVFVDRGKGVFEPREVETGWRSGGRVQIIRGLAPGERIVSSGHFLMDAESRMDPALADMHSALAVDPVCGVSVSIRKADKAGLKVLHGGKAFYFSADSCLKRFKADPERFVNMMLQQTAE